MQSRACSARFPHFSGHCNLSEPDYPHRARLECTWQGKACNEPSCEQA